MCITPGQEVVKTRFMCMYYLTLRSFICMCEHTVVKNIHGCASLARSRAPAAPGSGSLLSGVTSSRRNVSESVRAARGGRAARVMCGT